VNLAEFDQWFKYHRAHFPAVDSMIAKAAEGPEPLTRREIKAAWAKTLASCSLEDARAATDHMHSGVDGEAGWPDRHPSVVLAFCRKKHAARRQATAVYRDGERAVVCRQCEDCGMVFCWHPDSVARVAKTGQFAMPLYTCAFPCTCDAGDMWTKSFPKSPRFDSRCAFPVGIGGVNDKREQAALLDWLENREPVRPANYEPAFCEFSEAQTKMEF
jgi:hypothetical protein